MRWNQGNANGWTDKTKTKNRTERRMPDYRETANHRTQVVETPTEARAGVTGHNVRYVLLLGTLAVVVLFGIVYIAYFT
jgi:cobalamin biosynthesis Mg chelatase CobN